MESLAPKKNVEGKWIILSEEKKNELSELLDAAEKYEASLASIGDIVDFFVARMSEKTKIEAISLEKAKTVLKSIALEFDEKKTTVTNVLNKIADYNSDMKNNISELDTEKFRHRIEKFQEVMEKFEPHINRFEKLLVNIDELKEIKIEEAKAAILKGHRKGYFENFQ